MLKKLSLLFLSGTLMSCSVFDRKDEKAQAIRDAQAGETMNEFARGVDLLGQEKYPEANIIFEKLMKQHPVSEFDHLVLYNSAAALEGQRACSPAKERYRIVAHSSTENPRLQVQALFRLSYVYECLGDDAKVISSLLDVWKRRAFLDEQVGQAEVPARLAAAYARIGNIDMAQRFLKEAEKGLKPVQVEAKGSRLKRDLLARTLYFMGRLESLDPDPQKVQPYILTVRLLQRYLIQAVNLTSLPWSQKSAEQIKEAYEQVWRLLEQIPRGPESEPALALRSQKAARAEATQATLVNFNELKALRFPDPQEPALITNLYTSLAAYEQRFRQFLTANADILPLTPEAERRQGLKREGRVVDPAPTALEKKPGTRKLPPKGKKP